MSLLWALHCKNIDVLKLANHVLLDQRTRGLNPERLKDVTP
jgi:hypothetical protein